MASGHSPANPSRTISRRCQLRQHIHSVIVSFNRRELTQQAIESLLRTTTISHSVVVVDNGSDEDTVAWLESHSRLHQYKTILLGENRFPGYAANRGWEQMPGKTTLLHRGDNDFSYLPGWCDEVIERFADPELGQLGLRTDAEELHNGHNVGGNCVIRQQLFTEGLRYDERTWEQISAKVPGYTEDSFMSPAVRKMGWNWERVKKPCIVSLSREDPDDPYYQQTWKLRGITPPAKETDG